LDIQKECPEEGSVSTYASFKHIMLEIPNAFFFIAICRQILALHPLSLPVPEIMAETFQVTTDPEIEPAVRYSLLSSLTMPEI
jgi:hypothetical protein